MFRELGLFSRNEQTRRDLTSAAVRAGLAVRELGGDPREIVLVAGAAVALRAPGGMVGAAVEAGAAVTLSGPTAQWFTDLDIPITGRRWHQLTIDTARSLLGEGPAMIKLADAKVSSFPARRFRTVAEFDVALAGLQLRGDLQLLGTTGWFDIHSEYRMFTRGRDVLTCSPYLIEDEAWSFDLHTHRASFHDEAQRHLTAVLAGLADQAVPPAAALDVARLTDGRYVLLEANQSWAAGPYGCDPDAVLASVLAANEPHRARWTWKPDRGLAHP